MKRIVLGISIVCALFIVSIVAAQSGGGYDLTWNTIDGGGGSSISGSYALIGAIGQADAGASSGGAYMLNGGFLAGTGATSTTNYRVYLPLILH